MNIRTRSICAAVVLTWVIVLGGCASMRGGGDGAAAAPGAASASTDSAAAASAARSGTVQSIREVEEPSFLGSLLGTVGGAAIGGFAGANIGGGSGQVAASSVLSVITGSVGAAVGRMFGTKKRYEVVVRHEDGIDRTYKVDAMPPARPGGAVRVEADGKLSAVAPAASTTP